MEIKIGINGFGRIGKLVFRIIEDLRLKGRNIRVVAINCPSITSNNLKYLICKIFIDYFISHLIWS